VEKLRTPTVAVSLAGLMLLAGAAYAQPATQPPALAPINPPPGTQPPGTHPPVTQPPATFNGQVQPWDPYGSGGSGQPMYTPPAQTQPNLLTPPGQTFGQQPPAFYPNYPQPGMQPVPPPQQGGVLPNSFTQHPSLQYLRFRQDIRFRSSWLEGESGREMDILDVDLSASFAIPGFFYQQQPLIVIPGFAFHFWQGPTPPFSTLPAPTADMPAQAYSAFLGFGWNPQVTQQFSGELYFSVGVYSDFDTITSDSVRFVGRGLAVVQYTPQLAIKFGIEYLDRNDIKLLPAGGVVWRPNDRTNIEAIFPTPKAAFYLTTLGTTPLWWYVAGEYGGGSWTVERMTSAGTNRSDQVDINDIRAFAGLEWYPSARSRGFVEAGWVFNRELVFKRVSADNLELKDTFMVRAGLIW